MYDLPVSLNCAQDGRESCPATVSHRVSERNLLGRKRSKQCVDYVPVSCVSHFRWPSYLTAVGTPLALFKCSVMKWLSELMKNASVIAQAPQNPSRHLRILNPLHFQQRCHIVENACEISFPLLRCPSVPCWQHKRIGKWKLCLRKTPSRRKACIFLCLTVPWTLLEKTMAVCQCISDCTATWTTVEVVWTLCALPAFCLEHQEPVQTQKGLFISDRSQTVLADEEHSDLKILLPYASLRTKVLSSKAGMWASCLKDRPGFQK